jgi:hypothetical protein
VRRSTSVMKSAIGCGVVAVMVSTPWPIVDVS